MIAFLCIPTSDHASAYNIASDTTLNFSESKAAGLPFFLRYVLLILVFKKIKNKTQEH